MGPLKKDLTRAGGGEESGRLREAQSVVFYVSGRLWEAQSVVFYVSWWGSGELLRVGSFEESLGAWRKHLGASGTHGCTLTTLDRCWVGG